MLHKKLVEFIKVSMIVDNIVQIVNIIGFNIILILVLYIIMIHMVLC